MITKETIETIRGRMDETMTAIAKEFGFEFKPKNCTYNEELIHYHADLFAPDPSGLGRAQILFERWCEDYGLQADDFGKQFTSQGEKFTITGLNPTRPKYPINAKRASDGRGFKFPEEIIKRELGYK